MLTASAVRDASNGAVIEGTTNLPDNTKLGVELMTGGQVTAQDFTVFVTSGKFHSSGFSKGASPLQPGKQKVHILTYFNANWQAPAVLQLVGTGGSKLKDSAVIHSEDPQLTDGDKVLDYTVDLLVPPVAVSPAAKSDAPILPDTVLGDKAITIVKHAVLVIEGSRSSMNVEDSVQWYLDIPGIRMGNGWSATPITKTTFSVSLDFIETVGVKEQHGTAIWEVNLVTKQVLYRNSHAKGFSWVPKD